MFLPTVLLLLQATANAELGYVMSLPDDFVAVPAVGVTSPDVIGCWAGDNHILLCVQRMHAVLGREHLKPADLPPRSQLMTVKWNGLDIDAIRTDTAQGGGAITVYTAQVPLRREAIQVVAAVPALAPAKSWQRSTKCSGRSKARPTGSRRLSGPGAWERLPGGSSVSPSVC